MSKHLTVWVILSAMMLISFVLSLVVPETTPKLMLELCVIWLVYDRLMERVGG